MNYLLAILAIFSIHVSAHGASDRTPPTVPTNFVGSSPNEQTVIMSWTASTDNVGVTGYDIWKDGHAFIALPAQTSYRIEGLSTGTAYDFKVRARDAHGNLSAFTTTISITTQSHDFVPPSPPGNLTALEVHSTSVTLGWDAATDNVGVQYYNIYQDGVFVNRNYAGLTRLVGNLTPATSYTFTVSAIDWGGNETPSADIVVVTAISG